MRMIPRMPQDLVADLALAEAKIADIAKEFADTNVEARRQRGRGERDACSCVLTWRVCAQSLKRVHDEMERVHNIRIKPARDGKRTPPRGTPARMHSRVSHFAHPLPRQRTSCRTTRCASRRSA